MKTIMYMLILFSFCRTASAQHYDLFYTGPIFTKQTATAAADNAARQSTGKTDTHYELGNFFITYGQGFKLNLFLAEASGAITFNSAMLNINTGISAKPFDLLTGVAVMVVPGKPWQLNQNIQLLAGLRCTVHKVSLQLSYTDHSWVAGIGAKIFE